MLEKILVCLDGSKAAEQILPYIADDAQKFGSELVLFRVVHMPGLTFPISIPGEPGTPMQTGGEMKSAVKAQKEAEEYLQDVAAKLQAERLKVGTEVAYGIPGEVIIERAREDGVTLIAISTHGHGGFRRFVLGSTAEFVLHRSSVPVLMVTGGGV
jgi:nucleotide-binding universal stress UspA family protein